MSSQDGSPPAQPQAGFEQPLVPHPRNNGSARRALSGLPTFPFFELGTSRFSTTGLQRSGASDDVFMFAIPGGGHAFVLPSNNPSATYEPGRQIAMGELIASKGTIKISWGPLANRVNTAYRRRRDKQYLRESIPVQHPIQACANCGQEGHTLQICVKPGSEGDVAGCPRCNTLDHVYDHCKNNRHKYEEDVFYLITCRGNRPPIRTVLKWIDIAAKMSSSPEYRPWSKAYAVARYRDAGPKVWDKGHFNYSADDAGHLPQDPDTGTLDGFATASMEGRLDQEFFVKPNKQPVNPPEKPNLADVERKIDDLKASLAEAEADLKAAHEEEAASLQPGFMPQPTPEERVEPHGPERPAERLDPLRTKSPYQSDRSYGDKESRRSRDESMDRDSEYSPFSGSYGTSSRQGVSYDRNSHSQPSRSDSDRPRRNYGHNREPGYSSRYTERGHYHEDRLPSYGGRNPDRDSYRDDRQPSYGIRRSSERDYYRDGRQPSYGGGRSLERDDYHEDRRPRYVGDRSPEPDYYEHGDRDYHHDGGYYRDNHWGHDAHDDADLREYSPVSPREHRRRLRPRARP